MGAVGGGLCFIDLKLPGQRRRSEPCGEQKQVAPDLVPLYQSEKAGLTGAFEKGHHHHAVGREANHLSTVPGLLGDAQSYRRREIGFPSGCRQRLFGGGSGSYVRPPFNTVGQS